MNGPFHIQETLNANNIPSKEKTDIICYIVYILTDFKFKSKYLRMIYCHCI